MTRGARLAASVLLTLVLGLCLAHVTAASVVRRHVLDAGTYGAALDDARAYDRVYTEVLTDPELTDAVRDLLGRIEVDPALAPDLAATTTNALRWALPPERVRAATEEVLADAVAYLRGDVDRFRPRIRLDEVLARVDDAAVTLTRTLLERAETTDHTTVEGYRAAVDDFVASLAAGRVPDSVPVLAGEAFDPDEVIAAIEDAAGVTVTPEVRTEVAARLADGDPVEALTSVAAESVRPYVEREVAKVVAAGPDGRFDVLDQIASRADERADSAAVTLAGVRDALGWFGPGPVTASVLVALACLAAIVALNRHRARRIGVLLTAAVAAVALLFLVVARLVGERLVAPIDAGSGDGAGSWNLPAGLRSVLGDVGRGLGGDLRSQVLRVATSLLLVALAIATGSLAIAAARSLRTRAGAREAAGDGAARRPSPLARLAAIGPTAGAAVGCVALLVGAGVLTSTTVEAGSAEPCNGHAELCDRRYDEVAYATTHNSMASPDVVKVWPEQDGDLTAQLDAGVRALMIDTHYWRRVDSVADLLASVDETSVPMSRPVAQAVLDTAGSLAEARPGTFLCHNECVYGGQPFVDALEEVGRFLDANPQEVVTLVIQDAITVEDTVAAFREAGVDDLVYDQADRWPTLGELIERDRRLVVFAESDGGEPGWYADAWEAMQDTPYEFASADELSCEANRGRPDASMLLVNHWVSRLTPSRADAAVANRRDVLLDRARRCERERGMPVNFLAVDFYNIGDLVGVVDELNGVG